MEPPEEEVVKSNRALYLNIFGVIVVIVAMVGFLLYIAWAKQERMAQLYQTATVLDVTVNAIVGTQTQQAKQISTLQTMVAATAFQQAVNGTLEVYIEATQREVNFNTAVEGTVASVLATETAVHR
jgi:hypothetical protein